MGHIDAFIVVFIKMKAASASGKTRVDAKMAETQAQAYPTQAHSAQYGWPASGGSQMNEAYISHVLRETKVTAKPTRLEPKAEPLNAQPVNAEPGSKDSSSLHPAHETAQACVHVGFAPEEAGSIFI